MTTICTKRAEDPLFSALRLKRFACFGERNLCQIDRNKLYHSDLIPQVFKKLRERGNPIINRAVSQSLSFQTPSPFFDIRRQNRFSRFSAKIKKIKNRFAFVVANVAASFKRRVDGAGQPAFDDRVDIERNRKIVRIRSLKLFVKIHKRNIKPIFLKNQGYTFSHS